MTSICARRYRRRPLVAYSKGSRSFNASCQTRVFDSPRICAASVPVTHSLGWGLRARSSTSAFDSDGNCPGTRCNAPWRMSLVTVDMGTPRILAASGCVMASGFTGFRGVTPSPHSFLATSIESRQPIDRSCCRYSPKSRIWRIFCSLSLDIICFTSVFVIPDLDAGLDQSAASVRRTAGDRAMHQARVENAPLHELSSIPTRLRQSGAVPVFSIADLGRKRKWTSENVRNSDLFACFAQMWRTRFPVRNSSYWHDLWSSSGMDSLASEASQSDERACASTPPPALGRPRREFDRCPRVVRRAGPACW